MTSSNAEYVFLNSVRRGLSAYVDTDPNAGKRGTVQVAVRVARRLGTSTRPTGTTSPKHVQIYGPGDVVGFDSAVVTRTDPRHDVLVTDHEPNYFPFIEFGEPDFVWRYTPEPARQNGLVVKPWLVLVVLAEDEFTEQPSSADAPGIIVVHPRDFDGDGTEGGGRALPLPDLAHSEKWAHVQIVATESDGLIDHNAFLLTDRTEVARILRSAPGRTACRLLCPRRLVPYTQYTAFVVPAYATGVAAGLERPIPDVEAPTPAWDFGSLTDLTLPYYFSWRFSTGERGDFEYAARQLKPKKLNNIGKHPVNASSPGYALPSVDNDDGEAETLGAEGALQSREFEDRSADEAFETALARLLNREQPIKSPSTVITDLYVAFDEWGTAARVRWKTSIVAACRLTFRSNSTPTAPARHHNVEILSIELGSEYEITIETLASTPASITVKFEAPPAPIVLPPIYARWHAAIRWLKAPERSERGWIDEINLDPRYRLAAGLGAAIVAKHQNVLMASAWEQLGDVVSANDIIRKAQVGHTLSSSYYARLRHVAGQTPSDAALLSGPIHARARLDGCDRYADAVKHGHMELTARKQFRDRTQIPAAMFDRAFARIAAARSPMGKRQRRGQAGAPLLERFDPSHQDPIVPTAVNRGADAHSIEAIEKSAGVQVLSAAKPAILAAIDPELGPRKDDEAPREAEPPPTADLDNVLDALVCTLDPGNTICAQTQARIDLAGLPPRPPRHCFDRIMAYPKFPQPMYAPLAELSQEHIAPGLKEVAPNTVGLLQSNRRFVEAFFAGFNHAFGAELLWREYPTDQRGSYARQFWDVSDFVIPDLSSDPAIAAQQRERWKERLKDIVPMHDWAERTDLGDHAVPLAPDEDPLEEKVVLVIRGDLLKKYPRTRIYAVKAFFSGAERIPGLPDFDGAGEVVSPIFKAELGPDITLLGFPIDETAARGDDLPAPVAAEADGGDGALTEAGTLPTPEALARLDPGYFFVFEGRPMETRFGLDEPADLIEADEPGGESDDECAPPSDDDLSWENVRTRAGYIEVVQVTDPDPEFATWETAPPSVVARKTFQKAFRLSIHARRMLPDP